MENRKLKAMLVQKNKTYQQCADGIGISVASFNKKINDNKFTITEATVLSNFLKLTDDERCHIFLK